jgi:uracil phosphoribosyltransferase
MIIQVVHPILADALARLRDRRTTPSEFRRLIRRAALLLSCEALRDLPLKTSSFRTPLAAGKGRILAGPPVVAVPVLRAGLGMLEGLLDLVPGAAVGVIGLRRDERTFEPHEYYRSLPRSLAGRVAVILDPMLATGGSLVASIAILKKSRVSDIRAITLLAAPEGVREVERRHPEVRVFTAAVDERLNRNAYILPGIGDAGDRLFGTE